MDYFQGVVTEYLRANRAVFVNTEYLLQLDPGEQYAKNRHWYCDVVAINHETKTVQLCEVSYSKTLYSLVERLRAWSTHWAEVVAAIKRDSFLEDQWKVEPRVFIPQGKEELLLQKIKSFPASSGKPMPMPVTTTLEGILPWKYRSWNGKHYDNGATPTSAITQP